MLVALRVKNFVLMDALELRLDSGFNVLTGETGAGKSIVVGALGLVLGGRASAEQVRPGADEAEVEALFDVKASAVVCEHLQAVGLEADGELVVRRVVTSAGRSRAYLNGRLCTASELASLAHELADVSSQHESVALTDPATHLGYLDRFARLGKERGDLAEQVAELQEIGRAIEALRAAERGRAEREAFLRFQRESIDALDPQPGEFDELRAERSRLRHAEKLSEVTQRIAARFDEGPDAISDTLARFCSELTQAAAIDPALEPWAQSLNETWPTLREIARELSRYADRVNSDPARLREVEERIYKLETLLRQHGSSLDAVLAARARIEEELSSLADMSERIAKKEAERAELLERAAIHARKLSAKRKQAATKLGAAIGKELADLGMGGARVLVDVAPLGGDTTELNVDGARLGREGIDRVELLISPNKGIDPKPLRRIASGGELSRALLALKRVLADGGPSGLHVFDEVDAGVGGAVAEKIGRAIADVAKHRQVLCITHLAPIAAFADAHFVVEKENDGRITKSIVRPVAGKERIAEIGRMLAGAKVTASALKAAAEMVEASRGAQARAKA